MKRRDVIKELERLGYKKIRDDGSHTIYHKPGKPLESVPRHNELNDLTAKAILKRAGMN